MDEHQQRIAQKVEEIRRRHPMGNEADKFTDERFARLDRIETKHRVKWVGTRLRNRKEFFLLFVNEDGSFCHGFSGDKTLEELLVMAEEWFGKREQDS